MIEIGMDNFSIRNQCLNWLDSTQFYINRLPVPFIQFLNTDRSLSKNIKKEKVIQRVKIVVTVETLLSHRRITHSQSRQNKT